MQLISFFQAVLEIHDEVAAQIENYTEEVEYMDGVSSVDEEDGDEERRLPDVAEVGRDRDPYKNAQDNKLLDCKHLRTLKSEKYCECFIFLYKSLSYKCHYKVILTWHNKSYDNTKRQTKAQPNNKNNKNTVKTK